MPRPVSQRTSQTVVCRPDEQQQSSVAGYSQAWADHVLATLPMWTQLLPLFLLQTAGRVSAYGNPVMADLLNVSPSAEVCIAHAAQWLALILGEQQA